jgi:hypothetical protein
MGIGLLRLAVIVIGALLFVAGIGLVLLPGGAAAGAGIEAIIFGAILIGAALLERSRYRSAHAESSSEAPGPGGGEPTDRAMDPRFARTAERFVDPTSNRVMQVWVDPRTGERRYRAED